MSGSRTSHDASIPLLSREDTPTPARYSDVAVAETFDFRSQYRKSSRVLNFAYKSLLVSEDYSKRREYSDMSGTPIPSSFDNWEDPPPDSHSLRVLGEVISLMKALGTQDSLSDHIWKYFHRKALRYPLPAAPTCVAGLRAGFAVGLLSGDVFIALGTMGFVLSHFDSEVACLASNIDDLGGVYLAAGAKDGTLQIWHLEKSQELKVGQISPKRKGLAIALLRIARDNSGFVAAFSDNSLLLSNITCRDPKYLGKSHDLPLAFLEISYECDWFATAPRSNVLKIWAWTDGQLLYTLQPGSLDAPGLPFKDDIIALHISRENEVVIVGELSSAALLILRNSVIVGTIPLEYGRKGKGERLIHSLMAEDRHISIYSDMTFTSESLQRVTHWAKQVPSPYLVPQLVLHTNPGVTLLTPNIEVALPISCDFCQISLLYDLLAAASQQELVIYRLCENWKTRLLVSGVIEAFPTDKGSILLSTERQLLRIIPGHDTNLKCIYTLTEEIPMGFSPDGKYALVGTSAAIQFLSVDTGLVERSFQIEDCQKAVLSPQSEFLFLHNYEGVQIRSLLKEVVVVTHPGDPSEFIYSVVFSRNNNFASMITNRRTLLWDMRNQTLVLRYVQSTKRGGLFSTHRFYYLEYGLDMNTSLFSIIARRKLLESTEKTNHAVMCRDDQYCLIQKASTVMVLDFPTLIPIAEIEQSVDSFVLLPDEETLLTGSSTGLSLWNILEGRMISHLPCSSSPLLLSAIPSTPFVLALDSEDIYQVLSTKWYLDTTEPEPSIKRLKLYGPDQVFGLIDAYYSLGEFICGGSYAPQLASCLVTPYKFNALHIIAYMNSIDMLPAALKAKTPVIRGSFGSPLTVAIERKARRCLEAILKHIINLRTENTTEFVSAVQHISDDILDLIHSGSSNLMALFKAVVLEHMQGPMLNQFLCPVSSLPIVRYDNSLFISPKQFGTAGTEPEAVMLPISFSVCAIKWNYELGSSESIALLKALANAKVTDILRTKVVTGLIGHKWRTLWFVIAAYAILYFLMLLMFIFRLFEWGHKGVVCQSLLLLNVFFLVHEGFQAKTLGLEYLRDLWNYVDIVRAVSCIIWTLISLDTPNKSVFTILVAALCFLRGLTHFRAFSGTRYYVRMVLDVIKEASTFIILLFYTTFAFGIICSISAPEFISSPQEAFKISYELNMGQGSSFEATSLQWTCFMFASLVNVVVMLNLLVSILGDAFEKVQARNVEADVREMIETVLEYESLMVWKRASGHKQFIQTCSEGFQQEVEEDEWKGRASAIKKKVARVSKQLQADLKAATAEIKQEIKQGLTHLEETWNRKMLDSSSTVSIKSTKDKLSAQWQALEGQLRAWAPSFS